jgi:hypothetical protein
MEPIHSTNSTTAGGSNQDSAHRIDNSLFNASGVLYDNLRIKVAFIIFITFCLVNSDVFAENVLAKLSPKNYNSASDKLTERGIFSAGAITATVFLFVEMLDSSNII